MANRTRTARAANLDATLEALYRCNAAAAKRQAIDAIAAEHLRLETLETRNSDGLDFSDQAVWSLKAALEAAYEAGRAAR
jgi:hypothetical protein